MKIIIEGTELLGVVKNYITEQMPEQDTEHLQVEFFAGRGKGVGNYRAEVTLPSVIGIDTLDSETEPPSEPETVNETVSSFDPEPVVSPDDAFA